MKLQKPQEVLLRLLLAGNTNDAIAEELGYTRPVNVAVAISRIRAKNGFTNDIQLGAAAREWFARSPA